MNSKRWGRLMTIAVMAGAAAACDTTTGPNALATFDADAALDDHRAVDAVLSSNAWKNFQVLGKKASLERLGPAPALAFAGAMELRAIAGTTDAAATARAWANLAGSMAPVAANAPIISNVHRGKTFVYDETIEDYVVSERSGAPSNGVRFILYETESSGKPIVSKETGYFDLLDEGDTSAEDIALRLLLVEGSRTILDYATTLDENGPNGAITVRGFLADDKNRLDFNIDVKGSETPGANKIDVTFEMRVDARDFSIKGSVKGIEEGSSEMGEVDLTVKYGAESFRVDVEGSGGTISGTFYLNGDVFATMSGDSKDPTIVGATGNPPTDVEVLVLLEIIDTVEDIFDFFEDLMDPIEDLVILAVIL